MQSTCNETSIGKEFVPLFKAIECLDKFLQIPLANGNNLCTMQSYAMLIGPLGYSVLFWLINIHIFTIQTIQHHLHESRQSRFNCNFDEKFEDIE